MLYLIALFINIEFSKDSDISLYILLGFGTYFLIFESF